MRYTRFTFVIALVLMLITTTASAQCTPDPQYTSPGIYPDTTTGLPAAIATVPYAFTFTVIVPPDTNVSGFIIPIDSIGIDSVVGLPPGFSYITDSPTDFWWGDSTGCALFQGVPQQADVGIHSFVVHIVAHAGGIVAPYTIPGYKIEILDSTYAGVREVTQGSVYAYPNPATEEINVVMDLNKLPGSQLRLINSIGAVVGRYETEPGQARMTINVHDQEPGIYILIYNDDLIRRDMRILIRH